MTDAELAALMHQYDAEQREAEVIWFYRACEKIQPKVIVEIGIKVGGNFKILSTLLDKHGLAVGVDPWTKITSREIASAWKMNDALCDVRHVKGDSHDVATQEELQDVLGGRPIDVLFIDGDHSTEGMLADYADYSPLVRPGGIIAVHDIFYLVEVTEAWRRLPHPGPKYESPRNQSSIGIGYVVKL